MADREQGKAELLVEQSQFTTIGAVDRRPERLGAHILRALINIPADCARRILLGAEADRRTQKRIDKLADIAAQRSDVIIDTVSDGLMITDENFLLGVVCLQPFSFNEGMRFTKLLVETSQKQL